MSQDPTYGEPSGQEPTYAADADGSTEPTEDGGKDETAQVNPDLHGAAREVAEDAAGDGPAKTPGA